MEKTIYVEVTKIYSVKVESAEDVLRAENLLSSYSATDEGFTDRYDGRQFDFVLQDEDYHIEASEGDDGEPLFTEQEWKQAYDYINSL